MLARVTPARWVTQVPLVLMAVAAAAVLVAAAEALVRLVAAEVRVV